MKGGAEHHGRSLQKHLEQALAAASEPRARYHIREALQRCAFTDCE